MADALAVPQMIMAPQKLDYSKIRQKGKPIGNNPCREITLGPIKKIDVYPLDSFNIVDVVREGDYRSDYRSLRVTLRGYFFSQKEMEEACEALKEILRKRTKKEVKKIENSYNWNSHGYGAIDGAKISLRKF